MAVPQLSDEQLEIVRQFMATDAAEILFARIESGLIADWIVCGDPADREGYWSDLQAVLRLKNTLRDSAAMKRLNERNQERGRAYTT